MSPFQGFLEVGEAQAGNTFSRLHKTRLPATLTGSTDQRAQPPAGPPCPHGGTCVAQHLAQMSQSPTPARKGLAAVVAHKVTWQNLNSLKACLRQQPITMING